MSTVIDVTGPAPDDPDAPAPTADLAEVVAAVGRGRLVVLPTDTVYGIGADAFSPEAVAELLAAKGRGRDMPPPVLVPAKRTVDGLATGVPRYARRLMDRYWPGALTLVFTAQASLRWDLGDTNGTVAVRMPDHDVALDVLEQSGPLAVSSANRHGSPAATTAAQARDQLGESVDVYVEAGPAPGGVPSTIVDCTKDAPSILREGAIPAAEIFAIAGFDPPAPTSPVSRDGRPEAGEAAPDGARGEPDAAPQAEPRHESGEHHGATAVDAKGQRAETRTDDAILVDEFSPRPDPAGAAGGPSAEPTTHPPADPTGPAAPDGPRG